MLKISFVILHYNNIEDTFNCINSIKKLNLMNNIKINIIIVDNCSPDNSGKKLKEEYEKDENIDVILLKENVGFSKGNNVGYEKALENNPDAIMVINNDIIFEDKDFLLNYVNYIRNNKYDVIAPDIIDINNMHQNPLSISDVKINNQKRNLLKVQVYYALLMVPLFNYLVMWIYNYHEKKWYERNYNKVLMNDEKFNKNDFIPFGAFIIFANDWIKNEKKAFYSNTFMYGEEIILYKYLKKKNYKIGFCENMKVRHICGSSTNKISKSEIKKARFRTRNHIKASKEIIKYLSESE